MPEPPTIPFERPLPPEAPPRCPTCWTILGSYPASRNAHARQHGRGLEYRCPEHGVIAEPVYGRRLEVAR
jgi:hypothetical protein